MRRIFAAFALAIVSIAAAGAAPSTASISEHEVKAAVLFRVAKFIEWPTTSFAAKDMPFVMCVVGSEGPLRAFESLQGKTIAGRRIVVRRVTGDMLDLRQCQAAFFPSDGTADIDYALGKLQGLPVLTVGETEDFARRGGALALVTRDQRVTFMVNLQASRSAGLTMSSQLLQLASVIGEAKP